MLVCDGRVIDCGTVRAHIVKLPDSISRRMFGERARSNTSGRSPSAEIMTTRSTAPIGFDARDALATSAGASCAWTLGAANRQANRANDTNRRFILGLRNERRLYRRRRGVTSVGNSHGRRGAGDHVKLLRPFRICYAGGTPVWPPAPFVSFL